MLPTILHTLLLEHAALPCSMLKDQPVVLRQHSRMTCVTHVYEVPPKNKGMYPGL